MNNLNNEMNNAHIFGDTIMSHEYDKRIERRNWFKKHKSKIFVGGFSVTALIIAITFLLYMV